MNNILRGDVFWADLETRIGHEQHGRRPVVIVQNDEGNLKSVMTTVCPITANLRYFKFHVPINVPFLPLKSAIQVEQIITIDKCRLLDKVGSLDESIMKLVDENIVKFLALKKEEPKMISIPETQNEIQAFNFDGVHGVRVVQTETGPMFVARDVCDILEIGNVTMALSRLHDSMKGVSIIDTLGGKQEMNVVSEAGVYKLVFTSRKPEAERFTDWLASDVLPSIRKTGSYVKPMSQLEILHNMTAAMLEQEKQLKAVTGTVEAIKEAVISEPDNWREDINRKLHKIAQAIGQAKYRDVYAESYKLLEQRAGVLLERRLSNKRTRMFEQGMSNTAISNACKLDVIDEDKKLREIYGKIVSEYMIKYVA